MMQQLTGCTGDNCPKCNKCKKYYINLQKEHPGTQFQLESWATFGSATMWVNQETGESGSTHEYCCGPNGKYKMFEKYEKDLKNITLGEMRSICYEHQRYGQDCESCELYAFCNYELNRYPSGWKLGDKN